MIKNVLLLSLCWAFGIGAVFVQFPLTAIVSKSLESTELSTTPVGLLLFLSSVCAFFLPEHQVKFGSRLVYSIGNAFAIIGVTLCIIAVYFSSLGTGKITDTSAFVLIVFGSIFQAYCYAVTTRLRLAVKEFSTPEFLSRAVSIVIFGGVLGSLLGPLLVEYTEDLFAVQYIGSYVQVLILYALYFTTIQFIDFDKIKAHDDKAAVDGVPDSESTSSSSTAASGNHDLSASSERLSLKEIIQYPQYAGLVFLGVSTYTSMAVYMNVCSVAMKDAGYSLGTSSMAIFAHQLGMFVPSLISGSIVKRLGTYESSGLGFVILLLGAGIFWINETVAMFVLGILLIGIGWNFTFVAASARLVQVFGNSQDSKKAEGLNDTFILVFLGLTVTLSAMIYEALGWINFNVLFFVLTLPAYFLSIYMAVQNRRGMYKSSLQLEKSSPC